MQTIGLITKIARLSTKSKWIRLSLSHLVALFQLLPNLLWGPLLRWKDEQRSINKLYTYSALTYSITVVLYCETIISDSAFLSVISGHPLKLLSGLKQNHISQTPPLTLKRRFKCLSASVLSSIFCVHILDTHLNLNRLASNHFS